MQKIINIFCVSLVIVFVAINAPVLANPTAEVGNGAAVFEANCAGCHARGGNIVRRRRNLKLKALHRNQVDTTEAIASIVTNGKNNMSAYRDKLTSQEIESVAAYVLQRAEERWK